MLALADKNGEVMASVPGLSRVAGIPIPATQAGLQKFLSPDEFSRTPDEEGRRIEVVPGGWSILNYAKHRRMASLDEEKEKNKERQQRYRDRQKRNGNVTDSSRHEAESNVKVTPKTDKAEAEAEAEAEKQITPITPLPPIKKDNLPTKPESKRIANLYKRRLTTPWTDKEIKSLRKIGEILPEDLDLIEAYYEAERAKGSECIARHDLGTFLNNFHGELDRARAFQSKNGTANWEKEWE